MTMNTGIHGFKALSRVLAVFLAGVLLLMTTACSGISRQASNITNRGSNPPGQVQPYEGGMNNFRDVDPQRMDTSRTDAQAKALKDRVESNIRNKRADNVGQYVENYRTGTPLNERVENLGKDIQRGAENLSQDAKNLGDRVSDKTGRALENAKANTQAAGRDAVRDTVKATERATDSLERAADRARDRA
jgi:hypothetical protein